MDRHARHLAGTHAISKVNPDEGLKSIRGYMLAMVVGLIVVVTVPWISIGFLKF